MLKSALYGSFDIRLLPIVLLAMSLIAFGCTAQADDAKAAGGIGAKVDEFTARDIYGKQRSLSDYREKVVVVTFLGTECPIAKLYAPRLESLSQRFRDRDVVFLAIDANSQDSLTELAAFARQHGLTIPVLKDVGNRVADALGALRTAETYVLDSERIIRYRGRIDDQYGVGTQRPKPRREDLAIAIDELLAEKPVSVKTTEVAGCHIGRESKSKPSGQITYTRHVARIVNERCVTCHRAGEIAPFPLTRFEHFQGWGETIVEVLEANRMPPWTANPQFGHFRNDARLTDDEKRTLVTWINNGMPEGDPADLPPPRKFAEGWRMPTPDQVVYMSDQPFQVQAEGVIDYQYFEVDPGFTEDKYVSAAEARPDNRSVVHHIIVYIKPPGEKDFRRAGTVDGYAPGSEPKIYLDGKAKFVPAGSKFVFEMHYTANGTAQEDRSYVGLKFVDKSEVKQRVIGALAANHDFVIPPMAGDHGVTASRRIDRDVTLLNLTPHMHVRGKSFRYEARYPDGTQEVLLDVPRYDFNWQLTYELATPKRLPKGTQIFCSAAFDNSDANPANPDPTRPVRWGNQSWEEMMIGFFDIVDESPAGP